MFDPLVDASVKIFGSFNYEDKQEGAKRARTQAHRILSTPKKIERINQVATTALDAIKTAEKDPKTHHRWGAEEVRRAGERVLKASTDSEDVIVGVVTSEIDPDWILKSSPEAVVAMAGAMKACRDLSREFMRLDIEEANAD